MFVFHQTRLFNPRDDATLQRVDRARRSKRQASMVARQALTRVPDKVGVTPVSARVVELQ